VSFDPSTMVPGIDFTNDPVLQGRSFAYRDTDYHRLGTGNINDISVNRPVNEVYSNERDGRSKYRIDVDAVNYHKNRLGNNTPAESTSEEGVYEHYSEEIEEHKTRQQPGESFSYFF